MITKYGREQANHISKSGTNTKKANMNSTKYIVKNENGDAEIEYILYKVVVNKKEIVSLGIQYHKLKR